jgi:hypothetical protein
MDPVRVFADEVMEIIFSFLSAKEILNCTMVNSEWNDKIRTSRQTMSKFYLSLRCDWMTFSDEDKELLMYNSKYSNILISDGHDSFPFIYDIMSASYNWKSIKIYCTSFESTTNLVKLFKTFESTVENLVMHEVGVYNEDSEVEFNMKKLKSLTIAYVDTKISSSILQNCSNLESLTLGSSEKSGLKNFTDALQRCKKLKNLYVGPHWFSVLFETAKALYDFRLEDLSVNNPYYQQAEDSELLSNFFKFLEMQSNTLKKLNIDGCFGTDITKRVMKMVKLEEFVTSLQHWPLDDVFQNLTVTTLDIAASAYYNRSIPQIIKSVPNLKRLRLRSIDQALAELIAKNLKHLKKISLVHTQDKFINEILPNIEWV